MKSSDPTRRDVLRMLAALGIVAEVFPAHAQSTSSASSAGGKIVFENAHVRVIDHSARPRMGTCGEGLHSHPPHLTIRLTDTKAKVMIPGHEPFIAEGKAGSMMWDPGGPHEVINVGARGTKVYLVEFKDS